MPCRIVETAKIHSKIHSKMRKRNDGMKTIITICLVVLVTMCVTNAQTASKPGLTSGISVKMPVAINAVEMPAADQPNATVVSVTADGRVFIGTRQVEPGALAGLTQGT